MKKKTIKRLVWLGVICALLVAISSWYTITYNDWRFIVPMNLSEYVFRVQDLPMIVSTTLLTLYILCLFAVLFVAKKRKEDNAQFTRAVNPRMGFLGFLGFAGFLGFWTYSVDQTISTFWFFIFFGFFGFFYEGKMSHTFMDERYQENKMKAHLKANKIALTIIFIAAVLIGQGKLMGKLEYTLIALIIVIALSLALAVFLGEYFLFRYDHDELFEESEE
jgi:amino acid transporter